MAKLIFCLAAENIVTDSRDNKVSIINVVENFNPPALPAINPLVYFICEWAKERPIEQTEAFTFRLKLLHNTTEDTARTPDLIPVEFPAGKDKMRTIARIEGLPVREEGTLYFILEKQNGDTWEEIGRYPITIKIQTATLAE